MYVTGVDDRNAREWIFILDAQRGVVAKAERHARWGYR